MSSAPAFRPRLRGYTVRRLLSVSVFAAILVAPLQGCLLTRVLEVRGQFCDFESNFSVTFDESARLGIAHPVLLSQDITWLLDAEATSLHEANGRLAMRFVFEEAVPQPDPNRELTIDMIFTGTEGNYRLREIHADPKLNPFLNPQVLDTQRMLDSAQNVCATSLPFGATTIEVEMTDTDTDWLPSRQDVVEWLGPPHRRLEVDRGWAYGYRLKGQDDPDLVFHVELWFDEESGKPSRVDSRYARYRASADWETRKLTLGMEI